MKKDILFAILAAHNGVITEKQLLQFGTKWAAHPDRPLSEMIKDEITPEQYNAISIFVNVALKRHENNVEQTYMALSKKIPAIKTIADTINTFVDIDNKPVGKQPGKENKKHTNDTEKIIAVSHPEISSHHIDKNIAVSLEQVGKYKFKGEQSRGGMGKIMLAYDLTIGRHVAVKELIPDEERGIGTFTSVPKRDRFIREARVTGQLQHPSIIPVYEIGQRENGTYYYTMKLVKGKTLKEAIRQCKSLEDALMLLPHFRDICHAVSFAHANNVIHRDLKPENVMIGEFGETVLLDWGIAKIEGENDEQAETLENSINQLKNLQTAVTVAGHAVGTPSYMSPEQARGEIEHIDKISDIYSLGAVLYEILTGHPPFMGLTAFDIIRKVINEPYEPFYKQKQPPPNELAAIAAKALNKDKKMRYQSAAELAKDVESYMAGDKVDAHSYSLIDLLSLFIRQHKVAVASTFIILFILIGSAGGIFYQYTKTEDALKKELVATVKSHFHYAQALNRESENLIEKKQYVEADIYAASSLYHNPANLLSPWYNVSFAHTNQQAHDFKTFADSKLYLNAMRPGLELDKILSGKAAFYSTAFSPNGRLIAAGDNKGAVTLWDAKTKAVKIVLQQHKKRVWSIAFSHDSRLMATGAWDGKVVIWNMETFLPIKKLDADSNRVFSVCFSKDGRKLITSGKNSKVTIWNVDEGVALMRLEGHKDWIYHAIYSPDEKLIATASFDKTIGLWDSQTGENISMMKKHTGSVLRVAFSPDGQTLASASFDHKIGLWNVKKRQFKKFLTGHADGIISLAYAPDGSSIISSSTDMMIKMWNANTYTEIATIHGHSDFIWGLAFSPDARGVASASIDRQVRIWKVKRDTDIISLTGHTDRIYSVAFSPDKKNFATASWDGTIRIWDIENSGETKAVLKKHTDRVWNLAYAHNKGLLASGSVDKTVRIWDMRTFTQKHVFKGHKDTVLKVAFSPDDRFVASSSVDKKIIIWDLENYGKSMTINDHTDRVWNIKFSPDGKLLASASSDKTVKIRSILHPENIITLKHKDWISGVAFYNNQKQIFTSGKDGDIYLWDIKTKEIIKVFSGHNVWVNFVEVSPDGKYLASTADDKTVRIWDIETGKQVLVIPADESLSAAFSPDSRYIGISDLNDAKIYPLQLSFLDDNPKELLHKSEYRAGKVLDGFLLRFMTGSGLFK